MLFILPAVILAVAISLCNISHFSRRISLCLGRGLPRFMLDHVKAKTFIVATRAGSALTSADDGLHILQKYGSVSRRNNREKCRSAKSHRIHGTPMHPSRRDVSPGLLCKYVMRIA